MTKKLFALASVSALAGLMTTVAAAGCSSTTETTTTTDAGGDAAKPDAGKKDVEAEPDTGTAACPENVALTAADLEKEIGWKAPTKTVGACTEAEITKLSENFKDTNIKTFFDLGAGLADNCKACVFSKDTDANWQFIVGTAKDNGETGFVNYGACYAATETSECGQAFQYGQFCYQTACNDCATSQTERTKCVNAAGTDGMCKDFEAAKDKACPKGAETSKTCGSTVITHVKALCGAGTAVDGGAG